MLWGCTDILSCLQCVGSHVIHVQYTQCGFPRNYRLLQRPCRNQSAKPTAPDNQSACSSHLTRALQGMRQAIWLVAEYNVLCSSLAMRASITIITRSEDPIPRLPSHTSPGYSGLHHSLRFPGSGPQNALHTDFRLPTGRGGAITWELRQWLGEAILVMGKLHLYTTPPPVYPVYIKGEGEHLCTSVSCV